VHLKIKTLIRGVSKDRIKQGFTKQLFLSLNPPLPKVKLLQFDGCKSGDVVGLELNFILFRQKWVSEIVEDDEDEQVWYFIDKGILLPFFLSFWEHRHIVESGESGSVIIDDISFSTGFLITDLFLYPLLSLQFLYRKPIYRKWFKTP
tara:strand:- start:6404 stop:6847 length:444 start_codon:yes stop_codon:yes gene_type:complete